MGVVGFEQPTYTFEEDAGVVDVCVAFLQPKKIDPRVCVHLLGSTTDGKGNEPRARLARSLPVVVGKVCEHYTGKALNSAANL